MDRKIVSHEDILKKLNITLIRDCEYNEYMYDKNAKWREAFVKEGNLKTYDNLSLRYYYAVQPEDKLPRGFIVILHGYCGFWGKFHETAHYFWQGGYDVFFLEHRGHGYSGRQTDDKDLVHVIKFSDYVKDVKNFMDNVVIPHVNDRKNHFNSEAKDCLAKAGDCILEPELALFGHSMGGAIATLFLEEYPQYFSKGILSSPMFSISTGKFPKFIINLFAAKVKIFHEESKPYFGGKRFDGVPVYQTSSTRSEVRYNYIFNQRLCDTHYHTYMPSNGWSVASFNASAKALKNAGKIKVPILLLTAGNDSFLNLDGYDKFMEKVSDGRQIHFAEAKHEIFNDIDEVREDYYRKIFEFISDVSE